MADIEQVVDVQITRETRVVSRVGFGTPAALATPLAATFGGLIKQYNSPKEVQDGFTASEFGTAERDILLALFAAQITPPAVKLIKRATIQAQQDLVTITDQPTTLYTVTINGTAFEFTSAGVPALGTIATGLKLAIDAGSEPVTTTVVGNNLEIDTTSAGLGFTTVVDPSNGAVVSTPTPNIGPSTDVQAAQAEDDDFYGVVMVTRALPEVQDLSAYIETTKKLYLTSSDAAGVIDALSTTDIAFLVSQKNRDRTGVLYSTDQGSYPEAVWMGTMFPKDPGSATWELKELAGVVPDNLSGAERAAAEGKSANYYESISGLDVTQGGGVVASGEYIDVMRGVDWLEARMQESVFQLLATADKIPYTDDGITQIENAMADPLALAVTRNVLTDYQITSPKAADIDSVQKASRSLIDTTFSGTLAGAIHKTTIVGTVSV